MAIVSEEKQKEYIALIRRLMVMNPSISILGIQSSLENSKHNLRLDKDYINKLKNKIHKERETRYNNYTVKKVLAKYQDELEELKLRLWSITNDKDSTKQEKIMAIRETRASSKDMIDRLFDAGIFTRDLGKLDAGMGNLIEEIKKYYPKKEIKKEDVPGEEPTE